MSQKQYEAVVFDMDGVIFDSERVIMNCWIEIAEKDGINNIEEHYHKCTGATVEKGREILKEAYGENFPYDEYIERVYSLYRERYSGGRLPMKPGVKELLSYLKKENKKIALASSTNSEMVISQLRDANIIRFFDEIVCGDMVERSKPAPDIFLAACEKIGVKPHNAYAVEDSYNGIKAAYAGGLRAIMVPDLMPANDEMREKTEAVLDSLFDVISYLKGEI